MTLPPVIFAAGFVLFAAGAGGIADWEPTDLVARFADGTEKRWSVTNPIICQKAITALLAGRDHLPVPQEPVLLWCEEAARK